MINTLSRLRKYVAVDISIFHKLIIAVVAMIMLPILILSLTFYSMLKNTYENQIINSYENAVNQYAENIKYKFNIYQNLIETITVNKVVLDSFDNFDSQGGMDSYSISEKISYEMKTLINKSIADDLAGISLFPEGSAIESDGRYINRISAVENESWYLRVKDKKNMICFYYKTSGLKQNVISITRPISSLHISSIGKRIGFVKLDIRMENLLDTENREIGRFYNNMYIVDSDGNVVFSFNPPGEELIDSSVLMEAAGYDSNKVVALKNYKKGVLISRTINSFNWKAVFVAPYDEINKKVFNTGLLLLIIIIILLTVFIALTILLSKHFSNRIKLLMKKMQRLEKGELETEPHIEGNDEIGVLDKYFNRMIERLRELIYENYISKLAKKDAEIEALQYQINPHFLYNTLESIASMAMFHNCHDIYYISEKLGEVFKYNVTIKKNSFVTLAEEIEHVKNYAYIQKIRFKDRFDIIYDIPEGMLGYKVLKFICQPVVENAITHGFKGKKEKGAIHISARIEEKYLIICFKDNGVGMSGEQLEHLAAYIQGQTGDTGNRSPGSIGMRNIQSRINLVYGNDCGISIESAVNLGTKVNIKILANI